MRAVVSRVSSARVEVHGDVVGELTGPGLLVLLGVRADDDPGTAPEMARRLHELRVLRGDRSCADTGAGLLVVSQSPLHAAPRRGRRPSHLAAARPEWAEPLVDAVVAALRARGAAVATGRFGAEMAVTSIGDGPFTVLVDVPARAG